MKIESLHELLRTVPFNPFIIRLADGRPVPVPHPDFVAMTGGGRIVIVGSEEEGRFTIIDLILVTQLEVGAGTSVNH